MPPLKALVPDTWRQSLREMQAGFSMSHLSGPKTIALSSTEAVVTCLVKNGAFYVEPFIEHYFALGFRHIFFLDNGSTDATVDLARRYGNVTVFRSTMAVGAHQGLLKKRLAERAVPRGWCLDVDIDEFFDYPHSDVVPLPRFLDYLNGAGYTAVIAQMLDMFSDRPLSVLSNGERENLKEVHRYYDISHVTKVAYAEDALTIAYGHANRLSSRETALYWGGIRKAVYGFTCLLTKHPLFHTGAGVQLFPHNHYVNGATLADVSAVLRHFKFTSRACDEAAQNKTAFTRLSRGYNQILDTLNSRPDFTIKGDSAAEFRSVTDLVENGFLFASDRYRALALFNRRRTAGCPPEPAGVHKSEPRF